MRIYFGQIFKLEPNQIFVFGSNTQGKHGKGAALLAHKYFGAVYGVPMGMQGQSYAIVTKDLTKDTHPSVSSDKIITQINRLYQYARSVPQLEFLVAYTTSSNLNGYTPEEMAQMFTQAGTIPDNIVFNDKFAKLIVNVNS